MSKPGWKTTEFWMATVALVVGAVLASGTISHDPTLQVLGGISSALSALGYGGFRTLIKAKEQPK